MPEDDSKLPSSAPQPVAPAPPREVEVKLEAAPAILREAFALAPFAGASPSRASTFETTYYDTADNALSRAGLALRVRRAGRRRIMTLKWTPSGEEGFFSRGEQEAVIHGDTPDPNLLGAEAAAMIEQASGGAPLEARSKTIFRRRAAMVGFEGAQIEAAQDEGRIIAGEKKARIAELELELKSGQPAALFDFAASLTAFGFRVAPAPKGLRGHWLATGETPGETRAIAPVLTRDAPLDDVIAAILQANLKQFVANWPALSPDCPEAVHQMRVALRRLRSALGLFNRSIPCAAFTRFREEAKRIASAMGPARDQDVLFDLVEHGPAQALGRDASFDALLKASARKRAAAYKNVRALIEAPETSRFVLELQAMIARREWRAATVEENGAGESAPAFAAQALDRLDKRARKRGKNSRRACAGGAARRAHRAQEPALRCGLLLASLRPWTGRA